MDVHLKQKTLTHHVLAFLCPREDSNLHAQKSTGPQPAVYTIPPLGLNTLIIIAIAKRLSM